MQSGWLPGSIHRVLLLWDRFIVSKPVSQIQRRTLLFLQQASYTPSFGGLGLSNAFTDAAGHYEYVVGFGFWTVGARSRVDTPIQFDPIWFSQQALESNASTLDLTNGDATEIDFTIGLVPDPALDSVGGAELANIHGTPTFVTRVIDPAVGTASCQLAVAGTMADGSVVDLTLSSTETTYVSSNFTVMSFGSASGVILAGASGTAVGTVTSGGFSATVDVVVTRQSSNDGIIGGGTMSHGWVVGPVIGKVGGLILVGTDRGPVLVDPGAATQDGGPVIGQRVILQVDDTGLAGDGGLVTKTLKADSGQVVPIKASRTYGRATVVDDGQLFLLGDDVYGGTFINNCILDLGDDDLEVTGGTLNVGDSVLVISKRGTGADDKPAVTVVSMADVNDRLNDLIDDADRQSDDDTSGKLQELIVEAATQKYQQLQDTVEKLGELDTPEKQQEEVRTVLLDKLEQAKEAIETHREPTDLARPSVVSITP